MLVHHAHDKIPDRKPSGIIATLSSISCVIPTNERSLMNIRKGPGSSTSNDEMRQVASPNIRNSIRVTKPISRVLPQGRWSPGMGRPVSRGTWECLDCPRRISGVPRLHGTRCAPNGAGYYRSDRISRDPL